MNSYIDLSSIVRVRLRLAGCRHIITNEFSGTLLQRKRLIPQEIVLGVKRGK